MKWIKRSALLILILFLILTVGYFSEIIYGIRQLQGQLKIIKGSIELDEYLANPSKPDSIKQKLGLVTRVKEFSINILEFNSTDNYTSVYDQKGEDILWVLTASLPFKLEPKTWKFPFLGEVTYKGHFNLHRAIQEARELEKENWDVNVRTVTAWSTLGWFSDPVLTGMLDRREGELAELILHELTHSTLFVKDSVEFNENLASFIGTKAAKLFLISEYGKDSNQFIEYENGLKDQQKIVNFMLTSASKLDSLYTNFANQTDTAQIKKYKDEMITRIINNLDTVTFENKNEFQDFFRERKPNNAFFMNFVRYNSMEDEFERILASKFDGDLKSFLDFFKTNYPSL
jgi:predicted aminopeptidase